MPVDPQRRILAGSGDPEGWRRGAIQRREADVPRLRKKGDGAAGLAEQAVIVMMMRGSVVFAGRGAGIFNAADRAVDAMAER